MYSTVASQLSCRAAWLLAGQFDRIAAQYLYPLPVHLGASRVIVRSAAEATAMLRLQRAACLERGVVALTPRLAAMDLPRDGRLRIWVDWHERTLPGRGARLSTSIYYCRQTPAGFRIEMISCPRLAMPELEPHFAALALSA